MKIQTKIFQYGNEKEATWPSQYGTGEKGVFHLNEEGKITEGYPEDKNLKFGVAPTVIFDSMPPTYHEAACRTIESRKEWNQADKEHNTLTFGSLKESKTIAEKRVSEEHQAIKKDRRKASIEAVTEYKQNPERVKQRVRAREKQQMKILEKTGLKPQLKEMGVKIHD